MNKSEYNNNFFKIFLILLGIAILLIGGFCYYLWQTELVAGYEGYSFCKRNNFDNVMRGKTYSEKFGKVTCISCYDDECISEEFNVNKKLNILYKVKAEDNLGEQSK